jgi:hypothetical protein
MTRSRRTRGRTDAAGRKISVEAYLPASWIEDIRGTSIAKLYISIELVDRAGLDAGNRQVGPSGCR